MGKYIIIRRNSYCYELLEFILFFTIGIISKGALKTYRNNRRMKHKDRLRANELLDIV